MLASEKEHPSPNVHFLGKRTVVSILLSVKRVPCSEWMESSGGQMLRTGWTPAARADHTSFLFTRSELPQACSVTETSSTGFHTLHTYPLYLMHVWGLLTGPLETSFNLKMTPNGKKRKKKKPPHPPLPSSVGYSFLCKWRQISHLHLPGISTYGKSTVPGVEGEG